MIINESGINDAIKRKNNEENLKLQSNKEIIKNILIEISKYRNDLFNILETYNHINKSNVNDLISTNFKITPWIDVNIVYNHTIQEFNNICLDYFGTSLEISYWPDIQNILIKNVIGDTTASLNIEARLQHNNELLIVKPTSNSTINYLMNNSYIINRLKNLPKTIKQTIEIINKELNNIK